ncbi:RAB11-binding protein RELCH homolog isoform X2 [Corticium candelabrum]|uniref:RAB11-binding protein RELCH homolog isoform X2 n=1 Tax=Corticium candelabrum TaxID=121492 RepID=UPI002E264F5E|nr:RAB11-binding protein RELCH homolog isoform X2 [Corticium candelabrum]
MAESVFGWDSIAERLLEQRFLLSALELHLELTEAGKELPRLRNFFSNPGNFERPVQLQVLPRSASVSTFDSMDMSRLSDDGRDEDDKIAVLEYELRKANETIKKLRGSLTSAAEQDATNLSQKREEQPLEQDEMKPHEKRAINFLINEFLLTNGNKLTSITFADEISDQDLENWDNVGLNTPRPPDILHLYRNYGNHLIPQLVDEEKRQLLEKHMVSLDSELVAVKRENELLNKRIRDLESQVVSAKRELELRDDEIKHLRSQVKTITRLSSEESSDHQLSIARQSTPNGEDSLSVSDLSPVRQQAENVSSVNSVSSIKQDTVVLANQGKANVIEQNNQKWNEKSESHEDSRVSRSRQMSTAFRQALLASVQTTLNTRLGQEVARLDNRGETPVLVFGRCLPHIVPNVILAKREELIPVLLCTVSHHPEATDRDKLLNMMFNLIKRPGTEQRQMILSGCVAFAKHNGPTRVEGELLPQCWEQITHKYSERRLLVAESCGALAPYLPSEIRSSLVLSMLQQMLDDKSDEVRASVVRSLGLIVAFIDDEDKYAQCHDLVQLALKDGSKEVVLAAQHVLLPAFAAWSFELDCLEDKVMGPQLEQLKKAVEAVAAKSDLEDVHNTLEETQIVFRLETLCKLVSWQFASILLSGPLDTRSGDQRINSGIAASYPKDIPLLDLAVITGSSETLYELHAKFIDHISKESESWSSLVWFEEQFLPQLCQIIEKVELTMEGTVHSFRVYLNTICQMFGLAFSRSKIRTFFEDLLKVSDENAVADGSTRLTTALVPVYVSGVLAAFKEDRDDLVQYLQSTLVVLAQHYAPIDSLKATVLEMSSDPVYHEVLIGVVWQVLVNSAFQVRCCAASLLEYLIKGVDADLISKKVAPALVTLASDPEMVVRRYTIPAFGVLAESVSDSALLEKIRVQFQLFLDDPFYQNEHAVLLQMVKTLGDIGPNVEPKLRDDFILPRLTAIAKANNETSNATRRRDVAVELLEGFKALSCCFFSDDHLATYMVPGLKYLLADIQVLDLPEKETVSSLITEHESKIEERSLHSDGGETSQGGGFFRRFKPTFERQTRNTAQGRSKRKVSEIFKRKGKDS